MLEPPTQWSQVDQSYNEPLYSPYLILNDNQSTVDLEIFAKILFSRIALKDTLVMWKIRD